MFEGHRLSPEAAHLSSAGVAGKSLASRARWENVVGNSVTEPAERRTHVVIISHTATLSNAFSLWILPRGTSGLKKNEPHTA